MIKAIANTNTKIKKDYVDSSLLSDDQYMDIPKGAYFFFEKQIPAPNGHIFVTLSHEAGEWFFYTPHWELVQEEKSEPSKKLTNHDFLRVAQELGVDVAAIKAIADVEANYFRGGGGFLPSGKPKILFEAHWFGGYTAYKYNAKRPHISQKKWNRDLYVGGEGEWQRFNEAYELNPDAAIKSTSWGAFQVMGFHWRLRYPSVNDFYLAQFTSEVEHLECFLAFIKSKGLHNALRKLDFDAFARVYNGSGYKLNRYGEKLRASYKKYKNA